MVGFVVSRFGHVLIQSVTESLVVQEGHAVSLLLYSYSSPHFISDVSGLGRYVSIKRQKVLMTITSMYKNVSK